MLKDLFNKYGCDKAKKHSYHLIYEPQFEPIRNNAINLLEVGVFKGDSVRAWLDYFPNATIYGVDIFTRVKPEDIDVLQHPRVKWMRCDSTAENVRDQIKEEWPRIRFDVIIDDGLHTPEANAKTLANLVPLLKKNGMYFVEDVWPFDIMTSDQWKHPWITSHSDVYNLFKWDIFAKQLEMYQVERFDNRKISGEPDSYIIKVS
jgi:hypothetical protein